MAFVCGSCALAADAPQSQRLCKVPDSRPDNLAQFFWPAIISAITTGVGFQKMPWFSAWFAAPPTIKNFKSLIVVK